LIKQLTSPHELNRRIAIREQLLNGTYEPKPVRRVEIPKPDGGVRGGSYARPVDCRNREAMGGPPSKLA
jgi:hypothetical protein